MKTIVGICVLLTAAACGGSPDKQQNENESKPSGEVAFDPTMNVMAPAVSSTPADSSGTLNTRDAATDDPDQKFLRSMLDHHEGLIRLSHESMQRLMSGPAKDNLSKFDITQDREKQQLVDALRKYFKDDHKARATSLDRARVDSVLAAMTPQGIDSAMAQYVVRHNKEGLAMIDLAAPQLKRESIRKLSGSLRRQMVSEISEYEAKLKNH